MSIARQLDIPMWADFNGVVNTVFNQSLNLSLDEPFNTWSGTPSRPTGWTFTGSAGQSVDQVAPGGGAGTGAAKFTNTTATNFVPSLTRSLAGDIVPGDIVFARAQCSAYGAQRVDFDCGSDGFLARINAVAEFQSINFTRLAQARLIGVGATTLDVTLDWVTLAKVTPNPAQTTTPNADTKFFWTPPITPVRGETITLRVRQQDTANFIYMTMIWGGSSYELALWRVVNYVSTYLGGVLGLANSINGMRLLHNGTSLTMYTTTDGGTNWTQRDTTKTDSNFLTATGTQVLYTPGITPVRHASDFLA